MRRGALLVSAGLVAATLAGAPNNGSAPFPTPTDPLFASQWHHDQVRSTAAWQHTRGAGQVIAIYDYGIDLDHPDLAANIVGGTSNTASGSGDGSHEDTTSFRNHGTRVASVVASPVNGYGGVGVAPEAKVLSVLNAHHDTTLGVQWAVDNGATVVNMSFARGTGTSGAYELLTPTRLFPAGADVVVVVAAGNSSAADALCSWDDPRVICATATDRQELPAAYSSLGQRHRGGVTIAAPGGSVGDSGFTPFVACPQAIVVADPVGDGLEHESWHCLVTTPDRAYGMGAGTSFAAPIISGVAALVRSLGCDAATTVEILVDTARPPVDVSDAMLPWYGHGIVDAEAAVLKAKDQCSPP